MGKRPLNREALILLCIPGVIGLFLPVTTGESPLSAVRWIPDMAGPLFLSIIILAWQIRRLFKPTSSAIEVVLAFMFGLGAIVLLPSIFFVSDMISGAFPPEGGIEEEDIIYFIPYVLFYGPPFYSQSGVSQSEPQGWWHRVFFSLRHTFQMPFCHFYLLLISAFRREPTWCFSRVFLM